ncbi:hypothetical protein FZC66_06995 [Priestia megaterium]|nr:hypothetical protein FZC66_06995 [Priestia megaterium]
MISLYLLNILLPSLFFVYLVIINWCNLYPFNDIEMKTRTHRQSEFLYQYTPLLFIICCFSIHSHLTAQIGFIVTVILFIFHFFCWWFPYLIGAHRLTKREYEQFYRRTSKILPPISDHLIPDNQHLIMTLFLLTMMISESIYIF